jgi:hypothetical protein
MGAKFQSFEFCAVESTDARFVVGCFQSDFASYAELGAPAVGSGECR